MCRCCVFEIDIKTKSKPALTSVPLVNVLNLDLLLKRPQSNQGGTQNLGVKQDFMRLKRHISLPKILFEAE